MLDIRLLREQPDYYIELLNRRGGDFSYINDLLEKDARRREILGEVESVKAKRNEISKKIGLYKREKKDPKPLFEEIANIGQGINVLEEELKQLELDIHDILLNTPNVPLDDLPIGTDDNDNLEIKKVGTIPTFDFEPKPHWDLATNLDILDFERAGKISGSRFTVYKGLGARLERALINFMVDLHALEHGYTEIIPPYIVNAESMTATGQFPKFKEDAFKVVDERDLYLNPTAEVPTINLHRNETLSGDQLPIKYTAFTTAFRQEAGSAGRDTRGIIRQHQFNKVELIKFTKPENSYKELDEMLACSERVLQLLELPYRVVVLCTGDLGFSMRKTYDIEVWLPAFNTYREIGSISNAEDYQARRGNIKFKRDKDSKPEYVHTLNGSGLAVGRTVVAILENYQQADGTITIPKALIPYMKVDTIK
ncbi:serine--tRNA ligase [Candidatus Xianfuyuplasma coldseepsis]|uniref:Serine--tRNA ligase n=1 Tax=Candidatus Xianfuyuplasma coldseepsis TaxID=2782163 RepID=A0A7L7KQ76_9MOLU|nr:serine--tRNA ligase [Xianfuyuplasma coldseepsis]QMS84951.1 serine--tRNA ligase [Xianfuyuplasma coldseepsis]